METYIVKKKEGILYLYNRNVEIGKISPAATWVTEGMEFEENEVSIQKLCRDDDSNWQYACSYCGSKRECRNDEGDIAYIKGPCGHFH